MRYCSDRCRARASRWRRSQPEPERPAWEAEGLSDAGRGIAFLEALRLSEGRSAGEALRLAPFQREFVEGALADGIAAGILSVARGGGKSALSAGLALGALVGAWDRQPRREIILAARVRDQARIAYEFAVGFSQHLPDPIKAALVYRRSPRLEIEYTGDGGGHTLKAIAADAKSALGSAPTFALLDERGHWTPDRGDMLEDSLLTGLGKRGGRCVIISTSAEDDTHAFSRWIDAPPPQTYVQEHRPAPGLPADDRESLLIANPGALHGIGSPAEWLEQQAARAIAMGGHALTSFRLYNRNERVSGEHRDVLLNLDDWLAAEVAELPPRHGPVVIGLDIGGSASMSAAAFYWHQTGRLEAFGTFPAAPSLLDRGQADGVAHRYLQMEDRGELTVLGDRTVPVVEWLEGLLRHVAGETISAVVADRYKASELGEAMTRARLRAPILWRGMGFRDGGEDCERFRRAVYDGRVKVLESLLLRSALADAVVLRDPAANMKLSKARAKGRIDAISAAVLAVAEGARQSARPVRASADLFTWSA